MRHFWTNICNNDIVNIRQPGLEGEAEKLCRARVLGHEPEGIRVVSEDSCDSYVVPLEAVVQRVVLPWKPRDLADYFVIFRRRSGHEDEYVQDLRVRRNLVKEILDFLMEVGVFRPEQGRECRHMY